MSITKVELLPIRPQNGLIAFASINLDDRLYITSIGVHKRLDGKGYRITYPTRKVGEQSVSVCYPIESVLSKEIEMAICKRASELFGE